MDIPVKKHQPGRAQGTRLLLASGKPLDEPTAWRGSIVMNTKAELDQAYRELREVTFIKPQRKK